MKQRSLLYLSLAAAMPLVAGCSSSTEEKVYEIFKCGKAATLLGRRADADAVLNKNKAFLAKVQISGSQSQYAMQLGARFQEDYPLYKYQLSSQIDMLRDLYESKTCQALYK